MSRTSCSQFETIVDFMERNGDLNKLNIAASSFKWEELCNVLNSDNTGTSKPLDKWRKVWSDYKNNTKRKAAKIQAAGSSRYGSECRSVLTTLEQRVLNLMSSQGFVGDQNPNFSLVMQCCVQLVREGHMVDQVIDHSAFQQLLTLTLLTAEERSKITAENVRSMMECGEVGQDYCGDMDTSGVEDQADNNDNPIAPTVVIKDEIGVIHWQCSCDEISGEHDETCAAAAVDYLDHYRISSDQATCTICDVTLTWQSVSTLKRHLQNNHPEVIGIGDHDDSNTQKAPPPSIKLPKDIKVIHIKDPLDEAPSANKKRKIEIDANIEPITAKPTVSALDRFNSLNQFGLYVASLLKLLPKKKCIKYQNQIVDRLLKDLAAAA